MRIVATVVLTCSLGLLVLGCGKAETQPDADVVVIISPHNPHIRSEFGRAFDQWYQQQFGRSVKLNWRDVGGTGQILQFLRGEYEAADKRGVGDEGVGVDIFFGGGPTHERAKQLGISTPASISDEVLKDIPPELSGVKLYDPDKYWFGAALSGFGIIYFAEGLSELGIDPPTKWSDLADGRYLGRLVLADGSKSGSARACYEMVLQKYGWQTGLPVLLRTAGNTRQFVESSSTVPREVAKGSCLAGMCIDFYGYAQIDQVGSDKANFVLPEGETAIAPDPISLLRGAPHRQAAERLIEFVLSEAGQKLWCLRAGAPGGPVKHSLYRLPVRPDIYTKYEKDLVVYSRPFAQKAAMQFDDQANARRSQWLGWLLKAACVDNQKLLRQSWKAVVDSNMDPKLVAEFDRLPCSEDEAFAFGEQLAASEEGRDKVTRQWFDFYRAKYEAILSMAGGG